MATGLHLKAAGRAERFTAAIRDSLLAGDTRGALTEACRRLRAEAAKTRRQRPHDGPVAEAEVAGIVAALAVRLHDYKPPASGDLVDVFAAAFARTLGEDGNG